MWNPDPSIIDPSLDSRAATFENPTGQRGAGGTAAGGRKGAPWREVAPAETVVLADIDGPGTARHLWMTVPPAPPEVMRALVLEVFYDGRDAPSISVPALDFFGATLGRPVPYASALTTVPEGRGFNAFFPMPFREHLRMTLTNGSEGPCTLYYQLDYTLQASVPDDAGALHVSFRRENPTTMRRDFVIAGGLRGPGRFLGCVVGIRVVDEGFWYGEGEVKVYRDGDADLPTICGTGLEDYVGSAWGMGPHQGPYAGAPLDVRAPGVSPLAAPDFVGFYRWHVADPIVFSDSLTVTIQQIGMHLFLEGQEDAMARYLQAHPPTGTGWQESPATGVAGSGLVERVDDYGAAAFVYCREPQEVPRVDVAEAVADLARRDYEQPSALEALLSPSRRT